MGLAEQMQNIKLVAPQSLYWDDYIAACREHETAELFDRGQTPLLYDAAWRGEQLFRFRQEHLGLDFSSAMVPQSTFWLVHNDKYIGTGRIRHWLTPQLMLDGGHIGYSIRPSMRGRGFGTYLLKLLLPKARNRGIGTALIMCDYDNTASYRVIEKNGGWLHDVIEIEIDGKPYTTRRYLAET